MVTEVFTPEHNTECKNFETSFQQEKNCFCVFLVILLATLKYIETTFQYISMFFFTLKYFEVRFFITFAFFKVDIVVPGQAFRLGGGNEQMK